MPEIRTSQTATYGNATQREKHREPSGLSASGSLDSIVHDDIFTLEFSHLSDDLAQENGQSLATRRVRWSSVLFSNDCRKARERLTSKLQSPVQMDTSKSKKGPKIVSFQVE